MYHYIFFDLDGTLTDSKEGILNSLRYAFDKLGEPVPPESTLIKFIGPPLQDSFAGFCGFSAERAAEAIAAFRERYVRKHGRPRYGGPVRPAEGPGLCAGPGLLQAGEPVRAHL